MMDTVSMYPEGLAGVMTDEECELEDDRFIYLFERGYYEIGKNLDLYMDLKRREIRRLR